NAAAPPPPAAVPPAQSPRPTRPEAEAKSASVSREVAAKFTGIDRDTPFSSDPSFVFFRQIPDADAGPIGALGVPLTPGRSIAVDPRTTPLGSPVFISTEGQSAGTRFNRLMFAQDTGGAIRGAVRADFFWGFGPNAFARASRMRENGRMWLLLPKDLRLAASKLMTRGIGGKPGGTETECLVADPEFCVE
ncbi:MAG: 3D domain-containing protein, partial [Betaproteobacteria bacterium]